jgi:hypothetical protein
MADQMKCKFILATLVIVALAALVNSCQKRTLLLMFNNTSEDVTVISYDDAMKHRDGQKIKSGTSGEVSWPISMSIQCGNNAWEYATFSTSVPLAYVDTHHGLKNYLKIQIETNGSLDVLSPDADNVVMSNSLVQPKGFPLKPSETTKI